MARIDTKKLILDNKDLHRRVMYDPEMAVQVRKLAKLGATMKEMADFFNVSPQTLKKWAEQHPELGQAMMQGKLIADLKVTESLYRLATGYKLNAVKVTVTKEGEEIITPYVQEMPPSATAAIFWLKNRRPEQWKDKVEHEVNTENTELKKLVATSQDLLGKLRGAEQKPLPMTLDGDSGLVSEQTPVTPTEPAEPAK